MLYNAFWRFHTLSTFSRRELFRHGSAVAATAFTIVAPRTVRGSQANSKISVGLIGSGGRGTYDATIVSTDPRARITALCDLFDDRIEAATRQLDAGKPAIYKDFEKLLASDVDAVIIATPPFEHPRMLEAAIQARKHVYCEKPMGVDLAGVKRVIAAARKADPNKDVAVGFQQRYGPVYLEAFKRIAEGQIGDLVNARGFWIGADPFKRTPYPDPKIEKIRNWFCYNDYSGDFIVEQDCHNFDVLHWFLNARPIRVNGMSGRKVRTTMEISDHLSLSFEFPNGIHVNYEANQISTAGFSKVGEEFTGTRGVIETSRSRMVHHKPPREVGDHEFCARHHHRRHRGLPRPHRERQGRKTSPSVRPSARSSPSWAGRRCTARVARSGKRNSGTSDKGADMRRRDFLPALAASAALAQTSAPERKGRLKQCVTSGVFGRGMAFEDTCREAARAGCYGYDLIGPKDWPMLKKYGLIPTMYPPGPGRHHPRCAQPQGKSRGARKSDARGH